MYFYVCIHCSSVISLNIPVDFSKYISRLVRYSCPVCGSGVLDLFDFNDDSKSYFNIPDDYCIFEVEL